VVAHRGQCRTCEDFENGLGNWSVTGAGAAGTSSQTYSSTGNSLYTRGGAVTVTSNPIDLSRGILVTLDAWVRRGDDGFSEDPDSNEDLVLEWRAGGAAWASLEQFAGDGTNGEIHVRSYTLPGAAVQPDFQIRIRQTGGNGGNNDYWHVDDVCLTTQSPLFYSFEEVQWTGAPGEAVEGSGSGLNGTVFGGASSAATAPAIAGNPGTCSYGSFDGVDDYIEIADAPELDMSAEVTVAAWINMRSMPSELHTVVSKDTNYEFHINSAGQVYWWWNDTGGATRSLTTSTSISLNQWYHIAVSYRSGQQTLYVNGAATETGSFTGTLANNDLPFYIGTDWNLIDRAFDGDDSQDKDVLAADLDDMGEEKRDEFAGGEQYEADHRH
jgi:hypothetical protein